MSYCADAGRSTIKPAKTDYDHEKTYPIAIVGSVYAAVCVCRPREEIQQDL